MSLPDYILKVGDEAAAASFGVKVRTVQSWRRRDRYPRVEQAREIVRLTRGEVDFSGIFGDETVELPMDGRAAA